MNPDAQTLVMVSMSKMRASASPVSPFQTLVPVPPRVAPVVWPDEEELENMRSAMENGSMDEYVKELEKRQEEQADGATDETGENTEEPGVDAPQ